ncbi:FAD-dependent monooxygenase [Nocardia brevicatena]|uniref:FAD-dependent monooxygenase n=1 Tax=Nocardia brevicatena TaxID=37327 RepID=UPI0009FBA6B4|nr:FAD-dependent monooxygenase [Nocardia brevicatena]
MPENSVPTRPHDVIISGAGPNGLMLACELALGGIHPIAVDALPAPSDEPKANGVVGQVVRLLDMRGLYRPFVAELARRDIARESETPKPALRYLFAGMPLELADLRPNPLYGLPIPQPLLVRLLAARARELGVDLRWGHRVVDFAPNGETVVATVAAGGDTHELSARFLVGADGGRSPVRKRLGIGFPGITEANRITRMGHAEVPVELRTPDGGINIPGAGRFAFGHNRIERGGLFMFAELIPGKPIVGVTEYDAAPVPEDAPMTFGELRDAIHRLLGAELPMRPPSGPGPHALRRTVDQNTRLAERYRVGNVLLLGDAAHVHSAIGGPGLNLGLQDAVNLGWKLAAHLRGTAPGDLLDSYESERRPVAERVVMSSLSQTALLAAGPEVTALRDLFAELLRIPEVTGHITRLLAGSDVRYDVGDEHPLSGRLVPDFTIGTPDGHRRVADLLHTARPVLLDLGAGIADAAQGWADRVDIVTATAADPMATALLIRPDGYITWATDGSEPAGLSDALTRWFGPTHDRTVVSAEPNGSSPGHGDSTA